MSTDMSKFPIVVEDPSGQFEVITRPEDVPSHSFRVVATRVNVEQPRAEEAEEIFKVIQQETGHLTLASLLNEWSAFQALEKPIKAFLFDVYAAGSTSHLEEAAELLDKMGGYDAKGDSR